MYVHINRATSIIYKCSPTRPRDPKVGYAPINAELATQLLDGNVDGLKDYFVLAHLDGSYTLERNEHVAVVANKKHQSTELMELTQCEDADFSIIIDNANQTIHFRLNRIFNVSAARFVGMKLEAGIEKSTMYFTKKNDPTYLLFCIEIPIDQLLVQVGNTISYPLPVACQSVSVYTKQLLNSYSVETM